ncbi:hypothetical protein M3Y96_01165300 [Aphelenchoides besseyi]|nr:hypothetical protein M3Y96_01165300 [Aphelenchoides besseyi]
MRRNSLHVIALRAFSLDCKLCLMDSISNHRRRLYMRRSSSMSSSLDTVIASTSTDLLMETANSSFMLPAKLSFNSSSDSLTACECTDYQMTSMESNLQQKSYTELKTPTVKQLIRNEYTKLPSFSLSSHLVAFVFLLSFIAMTEARSAVTAKCYSFGPGTTISGADYRRDYGLTHNDCAENCRSDVCCMGFEWLDGRCTLKSRSLNGTISPLPEAHFGLCIDYDDGDRDRFWDHEMGGKIVSTKEMIDRESCFKYCGYQEEARSYSWKTADEEDSESVGDCTCIAVLHSIKLSFGSASGFL